jgi:hypothetical protein
MADETLGVGGTGDTKKIAGGLQVSGGIGANGVTPPTSRPTVNTASVATTTLANACLNGILLALKNAGIINSDAA